MVNGYNASITILSLGISGWEMKGLRRMTFRLSFPEKSMKVTRPNKIHASLCTNKSI